MVQVGLCDACSAKLWLSLRGHPADRPPLSRHAAPRFCIVIGLRHLDNCTAPAFKQSAPMADFLNTCKCQAGV